MTEQPTTTAPSDAPQDRASANTRAWAAFAVVVGVALVGKSLLLRTLTLGDPNLAHALALEAPLVVGAVGLIWLAARSRPRLIAALLVALDVVVSASMLATVVYAAYFEQLLTIEMLGLAGQAGEVTASIQDLLRPIHLAFVIDVIPLAIAAAVLSRRATRDETGRRRAFVPIAVATIAAIAAGALVLASARLPQDVDSLAAARAYGVGAYQVASLRALWSPASASAAQGGGSALAWLRAAGTGQAAEAPRNADFDEGDYSGANVIVVQMEAVQDFLVGLEVDGTVVAPNLTSLAVESWYFPRTYAQIARGNTADAEFVMNTSLYPPPNEAASVRWASKEVPSLPRLLGEQGYATFTMHANTARFWNRAQMYPALGFDRYFDRKDIGWEPHWKWGASDEVVYAFGIEQMLALRNAGRPFYAQYVSMSSHHPYDTPPMDARPYVPPARLQGTSVGDYLSSQSYADQALGSLVAELKRTGLWEESIVVVYGDHFGVRRPDNDRDRQALASVLGREYSDADFLNVPLMIHVPDQTDGERVDATVGQVDILPTLADPLGLDLTGYTYFGRDAFVGSRQLLGMRGGVARGSMLNDRILFQPGIGFDDGGAIDLRTGLPVNPSRKDRADYEAEVALLREALSYTDGLPQREGAADLPSNVIIPNWQNLRDWTQPTGEPVDK